MKPLIIGGDYKGNQQYSWGLGQKELEGGFLLQP